MIPVQNTKQLINRMALAYEEELKDYQLKDFLAAMDFFKKNPRSSPHRFPSIGELIIFLKENRRQEASLYKELPEASAMPYSVWKKRNPNRYTEIKNKLKKLNTKPSPLKEEIA